eukprot:2142331-Amphidinium_carterae.1
MEEHVIANHARIPRSPCMRLSHMTTTPRSKVYPSVGLVQHPKKRVSDAFQSVVLGAEVRGIEGLVHPLAWRLAFLI